MKILYIDTSSSYLFAAVLEDNNILNQIKERLDKELSSKALLKINQILEASNVKIGEIDKILVVNGPGSFTGIRIGLTIAKTLAWAKKISIIPISSLDVMALSCSNENLDYIVPVIDARRGFVFGAIYNIKKGSYDLEEQYIDLNELINKLSNLGKNICFITNDNIDVPFKHIDYNPNIEKVVEKYKDTISVNPHSIDANYLKRTEAEESHDC